MDDHDALVKLVAEANQRSKYNSDRIERIIIRQDNLDKLVSAISGIQKDVDYTKKDVTSMKNDIKAILETPKKRVDAVIIALISTAVGSLVGVLITSLLGG